jgi:hypothetical protein
VIFSQAGLLYIAHANKYSDERNMLSLLINIIRNNTTVEYKILMRQLAMRNEKDHTLINRIQEVIQKYELEPAEKLSWSALHRSCQ